MWYLTIFNLAKRMFKNPIFWVITLFLVVYLYSSYVGTLRNELEVQKANVEALNQQKATAEATQLVYSKAELKAFKQSLLDSFNIKIKNLEGLQVLKWKETVKEVAVPFKLDSTLNIQNNYYTTFRKAELDTGCFHIEFKSTSDTTGAFSYTYNGNIITTLQRRHKKGWFWKFQWGKKGWEHYTTVKSPCFLDTVITTNEIITIKP